MRLGGLTCTSLADSSQSYQESVGLLPSNVQEGFRTMTGRMGMGPRYVFMVLLLQRVHGLTVADDSDEVTCKDLELTNGQKKSGVEVSCKVNSKDQTWCNLQCPAGKTVNGKDGVTKKKLICKCGKKCKWKNEKNKKISTATYQKWKCEDAKQPGTVP